MGKCKCTWKYKIRLENGAGKIHCLKTFPNKVPLPRCTEVFVAVEARLPFTWKQTLEHCPHGDCFINTQTVRVTGGSYQGSIVTGATQCVLSSDFLQEGLEMSLSQGKKVTTKLLMVTTRCWEC